MDGEFVIYRPGKKSTGGVLKNIDAPQLTNWIAQQKLQKGDHVTIEVSEDGFNNPQIAKKLQPIVAEVKLTLHKGVEIFLSSMKILTITVK